VFSHHARKLCGWVKGRAFHAHTATHTATRSHCNIHCNTLHYPPWKKALWMGQSACVARNTLQHAALSTMEGSSVGALNGVSFTHSTATHCNTLQHAALPTKEGSSIGAYQGVCFTRNITTQGVFHAQHYYTLQQVHHPP